MVLQSVFNLVTEKSGQAASVIRRTVHATCVIACAIVAQDAAASAGGVYVAGPGTGLDQVFSQALADHPARSSTPFWVVVGGKDVARTTKTGASPDIARWVHAARERGGHVYVCRTDMMKAGIKESELLDGVTSMYGYAANDWAGLVPARKEGIVLPGDMRQSQQILSACGTEPKQKP